MHKCYYCPAEFPAMWVFRNHVDEHHKRGDHLRSWACEDCGWPWPLSGHPPADAECDNCGGELVISAALEDA